MPFPARPYLPLPSLRRRLSSPVIGNPLFLLLQASPPCGSTSFTLVTFCPWAAMKGSRLKFPRFPVICAARQGFRFFFLLDLNQHGAGVLSLFSVMRVSSALQRLNEEAGLLRFVFLDGNFPMRNEFLCLHNGVPASPLSLIFF